MLRLDGAEGHLRCRPRLPAVVRLAPGAFAVLSMAFTRPAAQRRAARPRHLDPGGGGVLNVLLDYLLMAVVPWGLAGAAIATMLPRR